MNAAAKPLGSEVIAREQALDQLFAKGEITPNRLATETAGIGELQGRLRSVHLSACICKPEPCRTPTKSPAMSSSGATASRARCRCTITITGRVHNSDRPCGNAALQCRERYQSAPHL
jgi:hypothetical protein